MWCLGQANKQYSWFAEKRSTIPHVGASNHKQNPNSILDFLHVVLGASQNVGQGVGGATLSPRLRRVGNQNWYLCPSPGWQQARGAWQWPESALNRAQRGSLQPTSELINRFIDEQVDWVRGPLFI